MLEIIGAFEFLLDLGLQGGVFVVEAGEEGLSGKGSTSWWGWAVRRTIVSIPAIMWRLVMSFGVILCIFSMRL